MTTISSLQIEWIILTPVKGVANKKDRKICGEILMRDNRAKRILIHTPKSKTQKVLSDLKGNLSKEYEVLIITDKQFGMTKNNNFKEIATKNQIDNMFTLK